MINLNIIPEKLKHELRLKKTYLSLKNLFSIIVSTFAFYGIALLVCVFILHQHFISTIYETTLLTKSAENYTRQVRSINNKINNVGIMQAEAVDWSYLLEYLNTASPSGINLDYIKTAKDSGIITLRGYSQTRDELISFKDALENSDFFAEINFPIKNLLIKTNINFEISAKLNSYEFNKL